MFCNFGFKFYNNFAFQISVFFMKFVRRAIQIETTRLDNTGNTKGVRLSDGCEFRTCIVKIKDEQLPKNIVKQMLFKYENKQHESIF